MKERGIIFRAPMIRAVLDGRKTQTRRIVKPQPIEPAPRPLRHAAKHPAPYFDSYCGERKTQANPRGMSDRWCWWSADDRPDPLSEIRCPYGEPGDRMWVREVFCVDGDILFFRATHSSYEDDPGSGWKPSIHMPRWASRITLELTDVRVQRVQDISEEDARAEGVDGPHYGRWTDMVGAVVPPLSEPARPWAHSFAVA